MSRHLLSPLGLSGLGPEVASAFDKIQHVLSRDALKVLDAIRDRLGVRPTGAKLQAPAAEHLPKIHQALAEHRTLKTRYHSASRDSGDTRAIDPYHLTLHNGGLYLVAPCHLRDTPRIFAVERMRTVELTSRRFEVPASFDAQAYLAGAWGMLRGDLVTVRVIFARALAPYIRERLWHAGHTWASRLRMNCCSTSSVARPGGQYAMPAAATTRVYPSRPRTPRGRSRSQGERRRPGQAEDGSRAGDAGDAASPLSAHHRCRQPPRKRALSEWPPRPARAAFQRLVGGRCGNSAGGTPYRVSSSDSASADVTVRRIEHGMFRYSRVWRSHVAHRRPDGAVQIQAARRKRASQARQPTQMTARLSG
jgi:hypothetical protein